MGNAKRQISTGRRTRRHTTGSKILSQDKSRIVSSPIPKRSRDFTGRLSSFGFLGVGADSNHGASRQGSAETIEMFTLMMTFPWQATPGLAAPSTSFSQAPTTVNSATTSTSRGIKTKRPRHSRRRVNHNIWHGPERCAQRKRRSRHSRGHRGSSCGATWWPLWQPQIAKVTNKIAAVI